MTGETAGQRLARDELDEIERLAEGDPPAFRVESTGEIEDGWLPIEVSLDCRGVVAKSGHEPLADREHATLFIPPHFPFARPQIDVTHKRFVGLPYVLWGHSICLYHSDADWNPAEGMFGFIARLADWYRRAVQGRLVQVGQPLHPPLAYPLNEDPDCVVVGRDLPDDFEPAGAILVRRAAWRVDVVDWLQSDMLDLTSHGQIDSLKTRLDSVARKNGGMAFLGAVQILRKPLSFEFPVTFPALEAALSAQGIDRAVLLDQLSQVWLANALTARRDDQPLPLYVLVGAPMRGFARRGNQQMHLAVWQLTAAQAAVPSILTFDDTVNAEFAGWLEKARPIAQSWMQTAPIAWAEVQEARPQIVTRRDTGKPAQWLLGKNVLVLGCGALGARIAEHCIRAGVSKLVVADQAAVTPGILVRQPYGDADIGCPKALHLAGHLGRIRPSADVEILARVGDVRRTLLGDESAHPDADLIVDATANRGVSARIEWLRRTQQNPWPPILTLGVGHECERAVGALALPHATGAGVDILQSFADKATGDEALQDAMQDFFPQPNTQEPFQPEVGCSEPTFTGSDPEVAAAAGQLFIWSLRVLHDYSAHRPVAPKSLFLARLSCGRDQPAHVYLEWPNDLTAEDEASGFQVRIRPQALADMRAEARATALLYPRTFETGGILFGYFDDACRVAWVTAAEGPSPDSQRGDHAFQHGTERVEARIDAHYAESRGRVHFVGMWHTHPGGIPARASSTDQGAIIGLLVPITAERASRRAIQVVVGGTQERWNRWLRGTGTPDVYAEVVRRTQIIGLSGIAMPPA